MPFVKQDRKTSSKSEPEPKHKKKSESEPEKETQDSESKHKKKSEPEPEPEPEPKKVEPELESTVSVTERVSLIESGVQGLPRQNMATAVVNTTDLPANPPVEEKSADSGKKKTRSGKDRLQDEFDMLQNMGFGGGGGGDSIVSKSVPTRKPVKLSAAKESGILKLTCKGIERLAAYFGINLTTPKSLSEEVSTDPTINEAFSELSPTSAIISKAQDPATRCLLLLAAACGGVAYENNRSSTTDATLQLEQAAQPTAN